MQKLCPSGLAPMICAVRRGGQGILLAVCGKVCKEILSGQSTPGISKLQTEECQEHRLASSRYSSHGLFAALRRHEGK